MTDVTEGDMHYYYEAFHEFDKHQEGYISATVLGDLFRALGENPTSLELEVKRVNTQSSIPPHLTLFTIGKKSCKSQRSKISGTKRSIMSISLKILNQGP